MNELNQETMRAARMNALDTDRLAQLVEKKRECLGQLEQLGSRQMELICAGDLGPLLKVLSAKQRLLAELQVIEKQLDPFRDQAPESRQWRSPEQRQDCARLTGECQTLLSRILKKEQESELQLAGCRDQAAMQLRGAHVAAHARGAYTHETTSLPGEIDLCSER